MLLVRFRFIEDPVLKIKFGDKEKVLLILLSYALSGGVGG
jgi:hypothetical protein